MVYQLEDLYINLLNPGCLVFLAGGDSLEDNLASLIVNYIELVHYITYAQKGTVQR